MDLDGVSVFRKFIYLHRSQLESSRIPTHFWEYLYRKLVNQIFDAGQVFSLFLIDYDDTDNNGDDDDYNDDDFQVKERTTGRQDEDPVWTVAVTKDGGINCNDPSEIYLIDHTWSFRMDMARHQLSQVPDLLGRMCRIMGINENGDEPIDAVMRTMWKYTQMYTMSAENISVEERMPIWYVMDELGCAVNHSDKPNFRIVPFMLIPDQVTYSILFPIENCEEGAFVTRDFIENVPPNLEEIRNALLIPWHKSLFTDINFTQCEPDEEYFRDGRIEESLPTANSNELILQRENNEQLKVFTEYHIIREYLTDSAFLLVNNEEEADILWLTHHFKDYAGFSANSPRKFINQFPFEHILTVKDLLSIVARRSSNQSNYSEVINPPWLPITYNLKTELVKFVAYFQTRQQKSLDNHWIIKPWNLARGLDTYISNNLSQIMRLQQTGPKIVQKYIENPVLFYRSDIGAKVKFDVRYVVLLVSVQPLRAYIFKNFFLRFANKAFALNLLDDYQRHFTVMNYSPEYPLLHMTCAEFLNVWHEQYPEQCWQNLEIELCHMLRDLFQRATLKQPPCGLANSQQSRALYAVDTMLAWDENGKIQPKLLELNWIPDCQRACEYYPSFFNDVFKLFFLGEENNEVFYDFMENL